MLSDEVIHEAFKARQLIQSGNFAPLLLLHPVRARAIRKFISESDTASQEELELSLVKLIPKLHDFHGKHG